MAALALGLMLALSGTSGWSQEGDAASGGAQAAAAAAAAAAMAGQSSPDVRPVAPPRLRSLQLGRSEYLAADAVEAAVLPFVGHALDNRTLAGVLDALGALYDEQGIVLATPVIENVNAITGAVRVGFVEARLGRVRARSETISDAYLAYRLNLTPGAVADTRVISRRLERLTLTDAIVLDADFAPGAQPGETDLVVVTEAGPRISTVISLDSYGSRGSGRYRLGASTRIASLTGFNDPLNLGLTLRQGAQSLSAGYSRGIHPDGTRLTLSAELGRSRNVQGTDLRGRTAFAGAGVTHPLIVAADRSLSANALVQYFREDSTLVGTRTLDQRGWLVSLGANGRLAGDAWALSGGADVLVGRYSDDVADARRRFAGLSFNLAYNGDLPGGQGVASVTMAGQVSGRAGMPAPYGFTVTSAFAVRGYPSGALSGDSGLWLRAQIEAKEPLGAGNGRVSTVPFAFFDAGMAASRLDGRHVQQGRVASAGLGASIGLGTASSAEIFVARPLRSLPNQTRNRLWVEAGLRHRF